MNGDGGTSSANFVIPLLTVPGTPPRPGYDALLPAATGCAVLLWLLLLLRRLCAAVEFVASAGSRKGPSPDARGCGAVRLGLSGIAQSRRWWLPRLACIPASSASSSSRSKSDAHSGGGAKHSEPIGAAAAGASAASPLLIAQRCAMTYGSSTIARNALPAAEDPRRPFPVATKIPPRIH